MTKLCMKRPKTAMGFIGNVLALGCGMALVVKIAEMLPQRGEGRG